MTVGIIIRTIRVTRLVARPEDWRWSSAHADLAGNDDHLVRVAPAIERVDSFADFLGDDFDETLSYAALRRAESVGRPVGPAAWIDAIETRTGLQLEPLKRGRKMKEEK